MDEVFGRRELLPPGALRELSGKSDGLGWLQLGSHLGAILFTGALLQATWGTAWMVLPFIAHGTLINFLYAGQHELSHYTVFRTRRLNELFGRLFGFVLFYPRDFDLMQHYAHHRWTQDWERDGELGREPYTLGSYLLWLLGPSYWWSRWQRIARFAMGRVTEPYIPAPRRPELVREARWHLLGYAAIALLSLAMQSWAAVTLWLLPMLATKVVHQLQNTIEHLGLPHVPDIMANTRTTATSALMRWLGWNMQYHTAHHAFPGVPFHQLPELHQTIVETSGRQPQAMGYLEFQWRVLQALARQGSEAAFPDERAWIVKGPDGEPETAHA